MENKNHNQHRKNAARILSGLLVALFAATPTVLAETMSSTNYKVQTDVLSIGGNRSTSTNYIAEDTIGDLATGEDLLSTNYKACSGYQCFQSTPYISFTVREGLTEPGATAGAGVALGTLDMASVKTSNGTTINSIFINAESNALGGNVIKVKDDYNGLKRASTTDLVASATETLAAGNEGFGVCVFSTTQHGDSPTALAKIAPYNDADCLKTDTPTSHDVGAVSNAVGGQTILSSTGALKGGLSEILVKAARAATNAAGADYQDTLTFVMTGTF